MSDCPTCRSISDCRKCSRHWPDMYKEWPKQFTGPTAMQLDGMAWDAIWGTPLPMTPEEWLGACINHKLAI